jgi:hypothetical protein
MKTSLPTDIQSKTFTRRETLGFFTAGVIGVATTGALAETNNDRQLQRRADTASVARSQDHEISKLMIISF